METITDMTREQENAAEALAWEFDQVMVEAGHGETVNVRAVNFGSSRKGGAGFGTNDQVAFFVFDADGREQNGAR